MDIPVVMICVLAASLLECFIVLPAHLRHAFRPTPPGHRGNPVTRLRERFDAGFECFRQGPFRDFSVFTLHHRAGTIASGVAVMLVTVGLLAGGRLSFEFLPTPESSILYARASFVSGTERERVDRFLGHLEATLAETEQAFGTSLVEHAVTLHGSSLGEGGASRSGDQVGAIRLELVLPDAREVRNAEFIAAWRERIRLPAGLENLSISERRAGPPGEDVNIRLTGNDAMALKQAATSLAAVLSNLPGVLDTGDDMPWGREQLVYSLSPRGEALGMTTESLGRQLRSAFDGRLVQIYQDGADEIEVRVLLPRAQRERLSTLTLLPVRLDDGRFVPLDQVMRISYRQGFEALRHADGQLAIEVTAVLNQAVTSSDRVLENLEAGVLPQLAQEHRLRYSFEGRSADQRDTLGDMRTGLIMGLALMFVVLAWVFASWSLPLIVMAIIPFALVGALLGHRALGINLTILSLFGLFGLSDIVVNNAIILVSFYRQQRDQGLGIDAALVEAAVQRVRAVLLTSLTTIGGLLPLLFETSLQAQFLIPMAVSIAFGLGFSTLLVLAVIPALLSYLEQWRAYVASPQATADE